MPALSVLTICGTRPEAVKLAPVLRELARRPDLRSRLCVTAQHREQLDQVLATFCIVPDRDLDLMRPGQSLADLTARLLTAVGAVLDEERPDIVLVQGDTTTTMASALAAFYARIPVGHIEAGLRTDDRDDPFPEEINRRIAATLATWHFAPTGRAAAALRREGVSETSIHVTGNTAIDALLAIIETPPPPLPRLRDDRRMILATAHRRENLGAPLEAICAALRAIVERNPDTELVYPVHLNPLVQEPARRILGGHERIHLTPPADYATFVHLMARATLIITDSGGIQEEAPTLGKPVLVLRQKTERPEAIEAGTARLVGTDPGRIVGEAERLLRDPAAYAAMARVANPFGDGRAAARIVDVVQRGLPHSATLDGHGSA